MKLIQHAFCRSLSLRAGRILLDSESQATSMQQFFFGKELLVFLVAVIVGMNVARADVSFERDIAPVLIKRCLECHHETDASGKLALNSHDRLLKGGESGDAIKVGIAPEMSLLVQRLENGEMPPEKQGRSQKLPQREIDLIKAWIAQGAPWPSGRVLDLYESTTEVRGGRDWWSLQPVKRIEPHANAALATSGNPIDAWIGAKLVAEKLQPAPPADRRTLLRRVYSDLIGLPPTLDEITAFERDTSANAYEKVVDRLLASPHFGERWARYWLDLVRYAETSGYERDQEKPGAWRYRDWVIRAFNEDLPYDRFVTEQLAGDELPDRSEQSVIATGFLRLGTWNDEPNDAEEYKYDRLEDLMHVTGTAFLGLSIKCARCHDHKFDPIPQADYYKVASAFWAGPIEARGRELLGGPSKDELGFDVLGWTDIRREHAPLRLLRKGDPRHPLAAVSPGHLSLVPALHRPVEPAPKDIKTTQRRLQLAQWIVDPQNPLTARVYVNRLWQGHFGQGLVRSPNNFGFKGEKPTHPELLDWLASELMRNGWRAKPLHKLMVMSATYQQSSLHPQQDAHAVRDSGNRFWWKMERRRLDAESLRDALLQVSGRLDLKLGGVSFKPDISAEALEGLSRKSGAWRASPPEEQRRRSIYTYLQRSLLPPLMTTFDLCDSTEPCGQRDVSIVAPQALALLNNPFAHEQSETLAVRITTNAPEQAPKQLVQAAFRAVLSREPSTREEQAALKHWEAQRHKFAGPSSPMATDSPITAALDKLPVTTGLALHLSASVGVTADESGRVSEWRDLSGNNHHARQADVIKRPMVIGKTTDTPLPAIRLDGQRKYFDVSGQVITSPQFSVLAIATDRGKGGHREIFSNWDRNGNVFTAVFLGTTGDTAIRFTDDFAQAGHVQQPTRPFLLAAINDGQQASVRQNDVELAKKSSPLSPRKFDSAYVIGTQGNYQQEDWNGEIAEVLVFNRALSDDEYKQLWRHFRHHYALHTERRAVLSPEQLALASLCHVLINTNEFITID